MLLHRRVRDQLQREHLDVDSLVRGLREVVGGRALARHGVRMLRLRGAKYLVFEATQHQGESPALIVDAALPNAALRILFTVQPTHLDAGPAQGRKLRDQVVIWDVGRRAPISTSDSDRALEFDGLEHVEGLTLASARGSMIEERAISMLPEYPFVPLQVVVAAARDAVLENYLDLTQLGESWWLEQGLAAEHESLCDAQEIVEVDVAELDATLRKWADGNEDCFLHLLPEQLRFIDAAGPLLLGGSVGSGKTTILLYHLLKRAAEHPRGRFLLVSYSPELSHYCDHLLSRLPGGAALRSRIEVTSFAALLQRLIWEIDRNNVSCVAFAERRRQFMDYFAELPRRFAVWRSGRRATKPSDSLRRYEAATIPDEIREHATLPWDGETLWAEFWDTYQGQLTIDKRERLNAQRYVENAASDLPARRLAAFVFDDFIAQHPTPDELDLCHRLHQAATRGALARYDGIYVDEAQDLCEVQWQLLLEMLQVPRGLVMTGDPYQTLRPSGFHWNRLRKRLSQRVNVTVEEGWLSINLRNSRHIAQFVFACISELATRWQIAAPRYTVAALLDGAQVARGKATIEQAATWLGDQGVALVLDETSRESSRARALRAAGVPVLTALAAKGLEFDRVLLCDFFASVDIALGKAPESQVLRHTLLGHLYVALTRARRGLWLLESDGVELPAGELTVPISEQWLHTWSQVAPINQSGVRFLSSIEVMKARAEHAETTGQLREAATLYEASGCANEAARCFERVAAFAEAAAAYTHAEKNTAAERCHGRRAESERRLLDAAAHYERAELPLDAARCLESGGKPHEAAALWERHDRYADAARCYQAVNNHTAAQLCLARDYEAQARGVIADGDRYKRGEPQEPGLYRAAAIRYASAGAYADAGRCYLQADDPDMFGESHVAEAAKCFQKAGMWDEALNAYERVGMHGEAALLRSQIHEAGQPLPPLSKP